MADGQRHLSFNISETKNGTIHLATDIAITSKGLVDRPKKIYCHIPLSLVLLLLYRNNVLMKKWIKWTKFSNRNLEQSRNSTKD